MIMNKLGKKVIGTLLSMAIMSAAIPAMTSLASENNFTPNYSKYKHAYSAEPLESVTLEELCDHLTEVINYYYQNESKLPEGIQNRCQETFNYVSGVIRNPDSRPDNYAIAYNDLKSANRDIAFFADSDLPLSDEPLIGAADEPVIAPADEETEDPYDEQAAAKEAALEKLYGALCDMNSFENIFRDEMEVASIDIDNYEFWTDFGTEIYCDNDEYSAEDIDALADLLDYVLNQTIDAIDAYEQPAEEIAPDYGMNPDEDTNDDYEIDHQDSFTIEGEEPVEEDEFVAPDYGMDLGDESDESIDDDSDEESDYTPIIAAVPASSSNTPSAPASSSAPVIVVPDRTAIVRQVVDSLYMDVLNRKPDMEGSAYWVSVILESNGNVDKVIADFFNSAEFCARNMNDDEFVDLLYKVILNRAPSASEQSVWTDALSNGASRADVVSAFTDSAEFNGTCEALAL